MHNCKDIHRILEDYLAGEILPSDSEKLDRHLQGCDDCRALFELHQELSQMTGAGAEPDPVALRAMRSRVLRDISRGSDKQPGQFTAPAMPVMRNMWATAAMLLLGIIVGRWLAVPQNLDDQLLLDAVTLQAEQGQSLNDAWSAAYSYAGVSIGELENGRISLGFDVCRNVDVNTAPDSALAGDVLTHAILNSDSIGSRLSAIEMASHSDDPRLTGALLATLRQDPDPVIRIEALTALADRPDSAVVQKGLLAALRDDESVQVRLMVLEQLVNQALGPETLEEVILQGNQESDPAIFQRARELLTSATADEWL